LIALCVHTLADKFSHFDVRVLKLWMAQISAAKDQEKADMSQWKDKHRNDHNRDFDENDGIRHFEFDRNLSLPYNASLVLTIPNEHAPVVVGWRSYLPTSCNGVDDENDQDEPDLASPAGRALRRFEKVRTHARTHRRSTTVLYVMRRRRRRRRRRM
jgi:hypothetical protein